MSLYLVDMSPTYTIKAVSKRTGLSTHVIRVWERRYSAVKPERSETNRRLYSEEDVRRLRLLHEVTLLGHSIGRIVDLSDHELEQLLSQASTKLESESHSGRSQAPVDFYLEACLSAIQKFEAGTLEQHLMRASVTLSQPVMLDRIIVPLIHQIGSLWQEGVLRVANEHLASNVLKTFLNNMRGASSLPETAPRVLITTPPGQLHELGALVVAAAAAAAGWNVTYLGASLPAEEIAGAAQNHGIRAVCLSLVYPLSEPGTSRELRKLRSLLPENQTLVVGGRAAESYSETLEEINAIHIGNLPAFREWLEKN